MERPPSGSQLSTKNSQPSEFLRDGLELIALDDIAHLIFAKVAQLDSAFEADADFFHVVLETAQSRESAVVDRLTFPQHTRARGACDPAIGDETARHNSLGQLEDLLHFGMTDYRLAMFRIEHARHRFLYLVDQLVNDAVQFNLHAFTFRRVHGHVFNLDVEADHDRV